MQVIKTNDKAMHGYKYCITDKNGNVIAVLPTKESQKREFELIGIETDSMVEIMFMAY